MSIRQKGSYMRYVAIYVSPIDPVKGPSFKPPLYEKAYPQLFSLIRRQGALVVLVHRQSETYLGDGVFSEYWVPVFDDEYTVVGYRHHKQSIAIKTVYDKARLTADDVTIINPMGIRDICRDKLKSYEFIPDLHPASRVVSDQAALDQIITQKDQATVAIKELDSNGGRAVYVGKATDYKGNLAFPLIVQDFVDTSGGYHNLAEGMHDVRVALFDGEIVHGRLRTPGKGELRANASFGGHNRALALSEIPESLVQTAKKIDKKLARLSRGGHRFFSVDFGHDVNSKEWKVFELNAWPGLVNADTGANEYDYMDRLAQKLVSSSTDNDIMGGEDV